MQTIPAIIKDFDEEKSFALSIIENIQRENLNVVDEAFAYKNLMEVCKFTQNDLKDYAKFIEIRQAFVEYFKLTKNSILDIDKFFWRAGKYKYFNKKDE